MVAPYGNPANVSNLETYNYEDEPVSGDDVTFGDMSGEESLPDAPYTEIFDWESNMACITTNVNIADQFSAKYSVGETVVLHDFCTTSNPASKGAVTLYWT